MTIQPPAWLNIDEVIPADLMAKRDALVEATRTLVDAVAVFACDWLPTWDAIEASVDGACPPNFDDWQRMIFQQTGFQIVDELLALIPMVIDPFTYGPPSDWYAAEIIDKHLTGATRAVFSAFPALVAQRKERLDGMLHAILEREEAAR